MAWSAPRALLVQPQGLARGVVVFSGQRRMRSSTNPGNGVLSFRGCPPKIASGEAPVLMHQIRVSCCVFRKYSDSNHNMELCVCGSSTTRTGTSSDRFYFTRDSCLYAWRGLGDLVNLGLDVPALKECNTTTTMILLYCRHAYTCAWREFS